MLTTEAVHNNTNIKNTNNKAEPTYPNFSRGFKTRGNKYKDRYVHERCPECGGTSAYRDEWHTKISYKCLRRDCRHNWFVDKEFPKKNKEEEKVS